jgi:UDP-N-acetylglucosamine 4,6-dehydratase/5-epimerase
MELFSMNKMSNSARILITGACGSVGSQLLDKLLNDGHVVCAFDHSEDGLFKLDQKYHSDGGRLKLFVGDVRDEKRLIRAFKGVDIVYHCAALKHVYLTELNPFEGMQTNIIGVNNVINAAIQCDVEKVIFTSSDKAVNPSSTMGATKLLGEKLITSAMHHIGSHRTIFSSVRFGNVLNTNGSVLQIFNKQLDDGKPLSITSVEMTRFFITMVQAVDLCLYASDSMIGGEIFVSGMDSCNIMSLAAAVCGRSDFDYIVIGPKPGEKLYEELVTEIEAARTIHAKDYYVILPDRIEALSELYGSSYREKYGHLSVIDGSIHSNNITLSDSEVTLMLQKMLILN